MTRPSPERMGSYRARAAAICRRTSAPRRRSVISSVVADSCPSRNVASRSSTACAISPTPANPSERELPLRVLGLSVCQSRHRSQSARQSRTFARNSMLSSGFVM